MIVIIKVFGGGGAIMEDRVVAFVIKKLNFATQRAVVLTMNDGKRDLLFKKVFVGVNVCSGMLLSFNKIERNGQWICIDFEILACPPDLRYDNIYFLHHILEICNYFVPYNKPSAEIFTFLSDWFLFSHRNELLENFSLFNKIFVLKLLSLFGFCHHDKIIKSLDLYDKLTISFIDFTPEQKLEFLKNQLSDIRESDLDEWIIQELQEHPNFHLFKTLTFLYRS